MPAGSEMLREKVLEGIPANFDIQVAAAGTLAAAGREILHVTRFFVPLLSKRSLLPALCLYPKAISKMWRTDFS